MSSAQTDFLPATRARYAISAVFLVFGTLVGSWLPHIPDVKKQVGANDSSIGGALLCSGLGAVISMQLLGSLIHRFGSRNVAIVGGVGACTLIPSLMLHTTILGLCANLFCLGLCYGCLDVAMNSHAVQVQALHLRPIMSAIHGWFSFGGIIGGLTTAYVVRQAVTPFIHLLGTSFLLLFVLIGSWPFLLPSATDQDAEGPKFVIPHGFLLLLGILCACAFVAEGGILDWCALYVRESLHSNPVYGGIATALASGSMACGRFLGDPILHRFGDRSVIKLSGIVCIVGILAAVTTPSLWLAILGFAIAGFGIANMAPVIFNEAGKLKGIPTSVGVAALSTCGYGGFLLGPPIIGLVAHKVSLAVAIGSLSVLGLAVMLGSPKFSDDRGSAQTL